jgi:curved DNA-binding protein CbpA
MSDFYQLLGISPSASAAEVRQAYARLAREKHPDRFADPVEKKRAEREFQDITMAFNALVNPRSREEHDASRARPQPRSAEEIAQDALARGQARLESGDVEGAIGLLQSAVHHAPGDAAGHAALGRALARVVGRERDAVLSLEKATQLAPGQVAAFVDLAAVLARAGLRLRAQKALEAARRLAPRDARVARLASELGLDTPR